MSSKTSSTSSFILGIFLGAIAGALIAIIIYRQNKGKVFNQLQKKIEKFLQSFSQSKPPVKKKKKIIPPKVFLKQRSK